MLGGPSAVGMVSGTVYFQQVYLVAGEVVSNAWIAIGAAPSGLTLGKVAMWDATTGVQLAVTADQSTPWASIGLKGAAFTAPYTAPASGIYYVGLLFVASPTLPSVATAVSIPSTARVGLVGAVTGPILYGSQAGQVDIPNPLTIAVGTSPGVFWIGLS